MKTCKYLDLTGECGAPAVRRVGKKHYCYEHADLIQDQVLESRSSIMPSNGRRVIRHQIEEGNPSQENAIRVMEDCYSA
jgi:hypothetical protein